MINHKFNFNSQLNSLKRLTKNIRKNRRAYSF